MGGEGARNRFWMQPVLRPVASIRAGGVSDGGAGVGRHSRFGSDRIGRGTGPLTWDRRPTAAPMAPPPAGDDPFPDLRDISRFSVDFVHKTERFPKFVQISRRYTV